MGTEGRPLKKHIGDFVRDNLVFRVYRGVQQKDRDALAVGLVQQLVRDQERGGSGIVYVATRRTAEQLARLLRDQNIAAQAYHGGMGTPARHQVQERFMQGELDVVVATAAFGMGVDKQEIRFVLHYDHPSSLEAYIQEAGRAGRDKKEAYAILLDSPQSQKTHRFLARQGVPRAELLRQFAHALTADRVPNTVRLDDGALFCDLDELARWAGIEPTLARVLTFSFEDAGLVRRGPDCTLEATILFNQDPAEILDGLTDASERALAAALWADLGATLERQVYLPCGPVPCRDGTRPARCRSDARPARRTGEAHLPAVQPRGHPGGRSRHQRSGAIVGDRAAFRRSLPAVRGPVAGNVGLHPAPTWREPLSRRASGQSPHRAQRHGALRQVRPVQPDPRIVALGPRHPPLRCALDRRSLPGRAGGRPRPQRLVRPLDDREDAPRSPPDDLPGSGTAPLARCPELRSLRGAQGHGRRRRPGPPYDRCADRGWVPGPAREHASGHRHVLSCCMDHPEGRRRLSGGVALPETPQAGPVVRGAAP